MKNNTILLRRSILAQLEAAYPATLSFATILDGLEIRAFALTRLFWKNKSLTCKK